MRKLVVAMFISLDGYIEGPNKQLVGPAWSADLGKYWIDYNIERAGATLTPPTRCPTTTWNART